MATNDKTPATPKTNQLALWSMITGIAGLVVGWMIPLPMSVAAVVLGHIGLSQIKKTGDEGRNFAITGLITGYVGILVGIIIAVFASMFFLALFFGGMGGHHYGDYGWDNGMMNP